MYVSVVLVVAVRVHLAELDEFGEVVDLNFIGDTIKLSALFLILQPI
jgi:hypothetical protein